MIQKAYLFRLWPSAEHKTLFAQHFGMKRFVYNTAIDMKKKFYERNGKGLTKREVQDQFILLKNTPEFSWLYDVNSQSILAALDNAHVAYKNYFQGRSRYPKYKSRKSFCQSYQCPQHVKVDF